MIPIKSSKEIERMRQACRTASEILERRKREGGLSERADIETMFQFIDADEGRKQ